MWLHPEDENSNILEVHRKRYKVGKGLWKKLLLFFITFGKCRQKKTLHAGNEKPDNTHTLVMEKHPPHQLT